MKLGTAMVEESKLCIVGLSAGVCEVDPAGS